MTQFNESDQELVRRAKKGEPDAVEHLFRQHIPAVRAFVRLRVPKGLRGRESCSDLVQSACRDLLSNLDRFEYRGPTSFRNWFYTAALNKIREKERFYHAAKRDSKREQGLLDDGSARELLQGYSGLSSPSEDAVAGEKVEAIERAFDSLSETDRQVITLSRIVGLGVEEVGEIMGRTPIAVRSLLSRALVKLARALEP